MSKKKTKSILFCIGVLFLGLGGYKIFMGATGDGSLSSVIGIVSILLSNMEGLKSFKALGLEAELRDKIGEADALLHQIKSISVPLSEMLFSVMAWSGRAGKMPRESEDELVSRVSLQLRNMGVDDSTIEKSKKEIFYFDAIDLSRPIIQEIEFALSRKSVQWYELSDKHLRIPNYDEDKAKEAEAKQEQCDEESKMLNKLLYNEDIGSFYSLLVSFIFNSQSLNAHEKIELMEKVSNDLGALKDYVNQKVKRTH
ncbi:hypothetical protein [Citrobacter freundii]